MSGAGLDHNSKTRVEMAHMEYIQLRVCQAVDSAVDQAQWQKVTRCVDHQTTVCVCESKSSSLLVVVRFANKR